MVNVEDKVKNEQKHERQARSIQNSWFKFDVGELWLKTVRVDGIKFVDRGHDILCVVTAEDENKARWVAFVSAPDWLPCLLAVTRAINGDRLDWRVDSWRKK